MNSFQQSKQSRRTLLLLTIIIFIVAASDFFSGGFVRASIRDAVGIVNGGVFQMVSAVSASRPLSSRKALVEENKKLESELRTILSYKIQNEIIKAENNALRALVNLHEDSNSGKTVRIASSLKSSPFSTFIISAGSDAGIATGDYAVIEGGLVIGIVSEVGARTSLVQLLTAPSEKTDVIINGAIVEMTGRGTGNALSEIPREIGVSEGDLVFLKGGKFIAGVVGRVESTPANALKRVNINIPTNIQSKEFVIIFPGIL